MAEDVPSALDFDEDSIVSLLETFVSTQTGPQRTKASHPPDPADVGAQAAQRTVFQHAPRREPLPLVGDDANAKRRRITLLRALAESTEGSARAGLLTNAGELHEQLGDHEEATTAYQDAVAADPRDVVALRALRRLAMRAGEWAAAAARLRQEASLALCVDDRASALLLLAHVHLQRTGDCAAAEQAAREAAALCPADVTARLLVAAACIARGDVSGAGTAIADAAPLWKDTEALSVLLHHAGSLTEQGGDLADARRLYEQAAALDPASLIAKLGWIRTARALHDHRGCVEWLRDAADHAEPTTVASALRRAAAVVLASRLDEPTTAIASLRQEEDLASAWTCAELAAAEGDFEMAIEAFSAPASLAHGGARAIALARVARYHAEHGPLRDAAPSDPVHIALGLDDYVRTSQRLRGDDDGSELRLVLDAMNAAPKTMAADMVNADKAALLGDHAAALVSFERELEHEGRTVGATLAVAEVGAEDDLEYRSNALEAGRLRTNGHPMLSRALALIAQDGTTAAATHWTDEAKSSSSVRSAFAHTMAARLHLRAGDSQAARTALESALEARPDHRPALAILEEGPFDADARMRAAAAQATFAAPQAPEPWIRASMWATEDPAKLAHAQAALELAPSDPLLLESVVAALGTHTEAAGELLLASTHEREATRMARAAEAFLGARAPARAAKLLREAACDDPRDVFLRVAREEAELQASEFARVADAMMSRAREATGPHQELTALNAMAAVDRLARRDMQSARLSLQSIAESRPEHIPTARALEWDALREGDGDRIVSSATRLLQCLAPGLPERAARHRLRIELWSADPDMAPTDVDRFLKGIEDDIDPDPGLVRRVLGMAYAREDHVAALRALSALGAHMSTDLERDAIALERAHIHEVAGDPEGALDVLDAVTAHPVGLEARARLLEAAGLWERSAALYQEAANRSKDGRRAASLWRAAATIFEEELSEADRTLQAYEAAAEADITYLDVYRRLSALYREHHRNEDAEALTEARIEAGADTPAIVTLLVEQASLRRDKGDTSGAVDALEECLDLDAGHFPALSALVDIHSEQQNWQGTAESLIRIASLKRSTDEQVWAFSQLGALYDDHLQDQARAEAALRQVLKLAPAHEETLDRLASVLSRQGKAREAGRVLEQLVRRGGDAPRSTDYRIRLAAEIEATGKPRNAETYLERLRTERPTEVDVILALADHYERQDAPGALAMHLNRALVDLRSAIDVRPQQEALWTTMVRVLARRHGAGPASCAASAAIAAGHSPSSFEGSMTKDNQAFGQPRMPLSPEVDSIVTPHGLPAPVLRLFSLCEQGFDKALPFDAGAWRLRRVPNRDRNLVEEAGLVAEGLGIGEPKIRMTPVSPIACMPISGDPLTLVVGSKLAELTTHEERVFLFARALKVASHHLAPALRARPEQLDAVLLALLGTHEASRAMRPAPPHAQELRRKLVRSAPRRSRDEIEGLVLEIRGDPDFSAKAVPLAIAELGSRIALTLTGDVPSAVDALLKISGNELPSNDAARLAMVRDNGEAWRLVRFAMSDAHFEARTQAGVDA